MSHLEDLGVIELIEQKQKGKQYIYNLIEEETEVDIKGLITPEELKKKYF